MKYYNLNFSNTVFVLISISTFFILIYNIIHYSPILGYDAEAHFSYVDYLSRHLPRELKLPSHSETREFFNPPVGYLFPSFIQVFCRNLIDSNNLLSDCQPIYGKATQIFQSILYIVTICINLYTLKLITKSKNIFNVGYLILISLLAVNYRTISMIRGEPYILFFLSLFLLVILKMQNSDYNFGLEQVFYTGVIIACIALSRQWGFLLFIPLIVLLFYRNSKRNYLIFWSSSSFIGGLFSSWFYIGLYQKYGSFTAFNMESKGFSFNNHNLSFYLPNLSQLEFLFTKPIRPNLDNQFFSIIYSDLWGDYWGYFSFTSRFLNDGRNQLMIGDYLARVNIVSLFSTTIIVYFCYLSYKKYKSNFIIQYVNLAWICSLIGYLIFAIMYPTSSGDTIKSTYIIQAFHLMVFLASIYFYDLKRLNRKIYNGILLTLIVVYIHNFQSYLSHFPLSFYP
tara:strand:- start:3170 stop:4528 length:1359 start_codon:yes stop_codon:yes gene_type:complete